MSQNDIHSANRIAKKISILYGLSGLILYFDTSFLLSQQDKLHHEIIDQDVIKALSLIYFVEKNLPDDFNHEQINEIEKKFISICNPKSKDEIISEARDLCEFYITEYKNLSNSL